MLRILEFLVFAGLAYWLFVRWRRQQHLQREQDNSSKQTDPKPVVPVVEKMVACQFCGVRIPQGQALFFDGRSYCDRVHLQKMDTKGWLGSARWVMSPNYDDRPQGCAVDTLVIHHISLPSGVFGNGAIDQFFQNQLDPSADPYFQEISHLQVSSHFLIDRNGGLTQFVSTHDRAWHAGVSELNGRQKCNDFSIGIELEGNSEIPFEPAQYETLAKLTRLLEDAFPIQNVVGHSDIAPGRKTDPGPQFDWSLFVRISNLSPEKIPFGTVSR